MKRLIFASVAAVVLAVLLAFIPQSKYKDGVYEGESQAQYTSEPYYGQVKVTIKNGKIADVKFKIVDKEKKVDFNQEYEKYFKGNDEYIQQCRNDWAGVQKYPQILLEKQSVYEVDAISGATWSCNIFKAALNQALLKAAE